MREHDDSICDNNAMFVREYVESNCDMPCSYTQVARAGGEVPFAQGGDDGQQCRSLPWMFVRKRGTQTMGNNDMSSCACESTMTRNVTCHLREKAR